MIAQSSSAYLTLCVTIERYVAVCRPLKARAICTYGRAREAIQCCCEIHVTDVKHHNSGLSDTLTNF